MAAAAAEQHPRRGHGNDFGLPPLAESDIAHCRNRNNIVVPAITRPKMTGTDPRSLYFARTYGTRWAPITTSLNKSWAATAKDRRVRGGEEQEQEQTQRKQQEDMEVEDSTQSTDIVIASPPVAAQRSEDPPPDLFWGGLRQDPLNALPVPQDASIAGALDFCKRAKNSLC